MKEENQLRERWLVRAYLWATRLLYGPFAWAYDAVAWLVSFGYWSQWRLDAVNYLKTGSVLETGFGTGALLMVLAESGFEVTGLEPSNQMQKMTGRRLKKFSLPIRRVRGRSEAMPFLPEHFDNVVSTFPSNYILDDRTIREMFRVLNSHGRWVVLGLGVVFDSGFKRLLTDLWMGRGEDVLILLFVEKMKAAGFHMTLVDHQGDGYTLPVLIMEKFNDK